MHLMQNIRRKNEHSLAIFVEGSIEKTVSVRPYTSPISRRLFWLIAPVLLVVPSLCYLIWGETATVRITMMSVEAAREITVEARANPEIPEQSPTRHLMAQQSISTAVQATGTFHQDARQARGTLTWYNQLPVQQTIPKGTSLSISPNLAVVTESTLVIPAGAPPVQGQVEGAAHVAQKGNQGNIPAGTLNQPCGCAGANGLTVTNRDAFTGGQDEVNQSMLQQADVDQAVRDQQNRIQQQASTSITGQLAKPEHLIGSIACNTGVQATPSVGSVTAQAQVSITDTCQADAYNTDDAQYRAIALFRTETQPDPGYVLGQTSTVITQTTQTPDGITLQVAVKGRWIYSVSQKEWDTLRSQLAGRTPAQAETLLDTHLKAIKHITVNYLWFWLPDDPKRIILERTDA